MVHSHLRFSQMNLFRRVVQGRLAESAGPLAVPVDHSLRILNLGAADEVTVEPYLVAVVAGDVDGAHYVGSIAGDVDYILEVDNIASNGVLHQGTFPNPLGAAGGEVVV